MLLQGLDDAAAQCAEAADFIADQRDGLAGLVVGSERRIAGKSVPHPPVRSYIRTQTSLAAGIIASSPSLLTGRSYRGSLSAAGETMSADFTHNRLHTSLDGLMPREFHNQSAEEHTLNRANF